jgi:hypothetical protein
MRITQHISYGKHFASIIVTGELVGANLAFKILLMVMCFKQIYTFCTKYVVCLGFDMLW